MFLERGEGEGLPLGLIEASSCGIPIICGNQDGSVDAIDTDHANGFSISPIDKKELENRINNYLNDPELLKTHGNNGLDYVKNNFEYEVFKSTLSQIILNL